MKNIFLIIIILLSTIITNGQGINKLERAQISELIKAFKTENPKIIADKIEYPLERKYPLKKVKNKEEFVARFNEIFDSKQIKSVGNSSVNNWSKVGWRGIMFDNGKIWINEKGKITTVFYETNLGQKVYDEAVKKDKEQLPKELRNFSEPFQFIKTKTFFIRLDYMKNESLRYAAWKNKTTKQIPEIVLYDGTHEADGTGGNSTVTFINKEYKYEIYFNKLGEQGSPEVVLSVYKGDKLLLEEGGVIIKN